MLLSMSVYIYMALAHRCNEAAAKLSVNSNSLWLISVHAQYDRGNTQPALQHSAGTADLYITSSWDAQRVKSCLCQCCTDIYIYTHI